MWQEHCQFQTQVDERSQVLVYKENKMKKGIFMVSHTVGAKSDQQVNIYRFAVRCDRMWPSTQ